jgi:UDP-N-acetylmuramyl-tripeptide synthetase
LRLSELADTIQTIRVDDPTRSVIDAPGTDPEIGSIHYRAQDVHPGGVFVAIPGGSADGHDFIDQALSRGACVIVTQKETRIDVPAVQVTDTRKALAMISAAFYGNPSEALTLIAITGTNGKTTTAYIIEGILQKAGFRVGVIGTINYRYADKTFDNPVTTPESLDLQRILAEMKQSGITHVVMEVSSHAIDLSRIEHCWFDVAVFTNLSQDHLDFHGNMKAYWSTKKRLFSEYLSAGPKKDHARAVINCSTSRGLELAQELTLPVLRVGDADNTDVRDIEVQCRLDGISGRIQMPGSDFEIQSPLVGQHNVENILCAVGVAVVLELTPEIIRTGVETVSHIPGRLEHIENQVGRYVYVDYAHTPDALENVIKAVLALTTDRVICVFGCGGDRDREKRPLMGEIAVRHCDLSIVTSDNPRSEKPITIIEHILTGIKKGNAVAYSPADLKNGYKRKGYVVEPDRQRAIALGIKVSRPGDTVLIAGKGHETYQILGSQTIDFDDREIARSVLDELKKIDGAWCTAQDAR